MTFLFHQKVSNEFQTSVHSQNRYYKIINIIHILNTFFIKKFKILSTKKKKKKGRTSCGTKAPRLSWSFPLSHGRLIGQTIWETTDPMALRRSD